MLLTLLKPRKPQRASYVGAATNIVYAPAKAQYVVAPGALAARANRSAAYNQFDGGPVFPNGLPRDQGYQVPAKQAPVRSSGFLLALQGRPAQYKPAARIKVQDFTTYDTGTGAGSFPTQFAGLRYFNVSVKELALVALADAPAGAQWRIVKGGSTYAVYLVDTTDPNASGIRIQTPAGIKSARLKT